MKFLKSLVSVFLLTSTLFNISAHAKNQNPFEMKNGNFVKPFYAASYNAGFEPLSRFDELAKTQSVIEIQSFNVNDATMKTPTDKESNIGFGARENSIDDILKEKIAKFKKQAPKQNKIILDFKTEMNQEEHTAWDILTYFIQELELNYPLQPKVKTEINKLIDPIAQLYLKKIKFFNVDAIAVDIDTDNAYTSDIQLEVLKKIKAAMPSNFLIFGDVRGFGEEPAYQMNKDNLVRTLKSGFEFASIRVISGYAREDKSMAQNAEILLHYATDLHDTLVKGNLPAPYSASSNLWEKIGIAFELETMNESLGKDHEKMFQTLLALAKTKGMKDFSEIRMPHFEPYEDSKEDKQSISDTQRILSQVFK